MIAVVVVKWQTFLRLQAESAEACLYDRQQMEEMKEFALIGAPTPPGCTPFRQH